MEMRQILTHLFDHKTLERGEAKEILTSMAKGEYSDPEIAAFVTVYLMRSITVDELSGFRDALLDLCVRTDLSDFDTIDVCGTGGDGKDTFNISTLTTFVLAGAGAKVAKHGNYGVSSGCGSSNVMEHLGYQFSSDRDKLRKELDRSGVCFLHAPLFNPAMKNVAPVRKALRVKTFFNMLGPMVNPSFPDKQMVGVFSLELARLYNYIFQQSGKSFTILHSLDGYDEISLTSDYKVITKNSDQIVSPEYLNMKKVDPVELQGGGSVPDSAKLFVDILEGKGTETQNNVVVANAATALQCCFPEKSIGDCLGMAKDSLLGGKARTALKNLLN